MTHYLKEFEQTPKSSIFQNNLPLSIMLHLMGITSSIVVFLFFLEKHKSAIHDNMQDFAIGIAGVSVGYILNLFLQKTPLPIFAGLLWFVCWAIKTTFFN